MTQVAIEVWDGTQVSQSDIYRRQVRGRVIELGEFREVWEPTITIGSDPRCTVVLPELRPVEVRLVGLGHHRVLYRMPEGTTLPLAPFDRCERAYDERIDRNVFELGPYLLKVIERSEDGREW